MRKLPEVQDAKDLMNEAMEWSSFKWLFEKSKVRQTADRANDALDHQNRAIKARWSNEVKTAFKKLSASKHAPGQHVEDNHQPGGANSDLGLLIVEIIKADEAAHRARMKAEEAFEEAERQMSTSLAREGCKKAIHSWELHEKATRKAEALAAAGHLDE